MRLGCGPGLYGRPGLRCYDARPDGHLSVSLAYLRDGLVWCRQAGLRMLRLHWRLAPGPADAALAQIEACRAELAWLGGMARAADIRLTLHAPLGAELGAAQPAVAEAASRALITLAALLDALDAQGGVVVSHIGGAGEAAPHRWAARALALPPGARRRLAVEHDLSHPVGMALAVHSVCGAPVVFDDLHHRLRPAGLDGQTALARCLATWPPGVTPKVHFSSPRTEARLVRRRGLVEARLPRPEAHADLINPFEFIAFLRGAVGQPDFDVLVEARASDVAVLRLRADVARLAPDLAERLEIGG